MLERFGVGSVPPRVSSLQLAVAPCATKSETSPRSLRHRPAAPEAHRSQAFASSGMAGRGVACLFAACRLWTVSTFACGTMIRAVSVAYAAAVRACSVACVRRGMYVGRLGRRQCDDIHGGASMVLVLSDLRCTGLGFARHALHIKQGG